MPGAREIKRRIRSIGSTKKITRAMQMVSAAKMRRAQLAVAASRPYAVYARELAARVQGVESDADEFKTVHKNRPCIALIVVTPNRGQVGALNSNVVAAARTFASKVSAEDKDIAILAMGKKARDGMLRLGFSLEADFLKNDKNVSVADIKPLAAFIAKEFAAGTFAEVHVAYPKFISTLNQKAVVEQVLPFEAAPGAVTEDDPKSSKRQTDYLFEPDRKQVLEALLPRITEAHVYRAVLEANASEHSARMVMMKNATEAAGDLVDELTLSYNRLRQANITQELAEITAGRIAME
jgi:F-type H+-transporting ATPase subunit gamma